MSPVSVLLYDILDAGASAAYLAGSSLVTVETIELVRRDLEDLNGLRWSAKPRHGQGPRGGEMTKYERGARGKVVAKRRGKVLIFILLYLR